MAEGDIKLTIRQNNGTQFEVTVNAKASVKELKGACVDQSEIPADE